MEETYDLNYSQIVAIFKKWHQDSEKNPENFTNEEVDSDVYGKDCADYFVSKIKDI